MTARAACLVLVLPAAVLPAAARAECPGPGALSQGIVVETMRGTEHFARGAGGAVIVTVRPGGADFTEVTEYAGAVIPAVTRVAPDEGAERTGSLSVLDFDRGALDALLPLEPGDALRLPARYSRDDPPMEVDLGIVLSVGVAETVRIGDCAYAALPVTWALERPDGTFTTVLNFIPDLGIAYTARRELPTGQVDDDAATAIRAEGG